MRRSELYLRISGRLTRLLTSNWEIAMNSSFTALQSLKRLALRRDWPVARFVRLGLSLLFLSSSYGMVVAGEVSSGTSLDLDAYRPSQNSVAADGVSLNDIVGIGIAGSNDHVYVWYTDGTVSSGTTRDLGTYRVRQNFALPLGYWTSDIVGMAIAGSSDWVYTWYRDGMVSAGSSTDLAKHRQPYAYSLPDDKGPLSIVGLGIAGSNDRVYVWYADGTVSAGSTRDLDASQSPQPYSLPSGYNHDQVIGLGIAGSDDHVYAWYGNCTPPTSQTLNLRNTPQETSRWCWAASAQMVMNYVANQNIPQCTQANNRFGRTDCCNTPTPGPTGSNCILGGWPEFEKYGFTAKIKNSALTWNELRQEIGNGGSCRGRPFAFSWNWYHQRADGTWYLEGGHMMVAMGYYTVNNDKYVLVQDPWPPNGGQYRVDNYEVFKRLDHDHEHWPDYYDVTFIGDD